MPIIRITGLPLEANVQKQLKILRLHLRKCDVEKFWINEMSDTRGTEFKEAAIEVTTQDDAYRMESFFSKVPYRKDGMPHFLRAEVVNHDYDHNRSRSRSPQTVHQSNTKHKSRDRQYERYSPTDSQERYRSHSPLYQEEPSHLDIEIELLRKKRQLVEEERRLLAEKTKLELMQEYGANSSRELGYFEESRDRETRPRRSDRMRGLSPAPPTKAPANRVALPLFVMPCKNILKQMRSVVHAATKSKQERALVLKLLRAHLRRSLALALADRDFMPTNAIIQLYREKQPVEKDEEYVKKILQDVRCCFWPMKPEPQRQTPQEKRQANKKTNPGAPGTVVKKEKNQGAQEKPVTIKKEVDVKPNVEGIKPSAAGLISQVPTNIAEDIVVKVESSNESNETETTNRDRVNPSKSVDQLDTSNPVESTETDRQGSTDLTGQAEATNLEPISASNTVDQSNNDGGEDKIESANAEVVKPVASSNAEEQYDVDEDDWVTNGIDWEDDDDESKEEQ